ncbi:hypothetical protein BRC68_07255 [Halobacteriales archaeon QH_6_64_20]|nr:MAG: hypothetical protein BRC68_07255 [Halobacteriales archaeon QH_6_64_20]
MATMPTAVLTGDRSLAAATVVSARRRFACWKTCRPTGTRRRRSRPANVASSPGELRRHLRLPGNRRPIDHDERLGLDARSRNDPLELH